MFSQNCRVGPLKDVTCDPIKSKVPSIFSQVRLLYYSWPKVVDLLATRVEATTIIAGDQREPL